MKNILLLSLLIVTSITATAQKPSPAKQVDAYIAQQMREKKITGLSLAVVKDGKVVKTAGYGMANIENKVPATVQTVYKIGSVSKQFLAAGILLLQQDGKLHITDPLSRHIPNVPAEWSAITLQRLLNHSAGLPLDIPAFDPYKMQTDSALTSSLFTVPLLYPPGDKLSYSNAGYFIIAEVIRRVSGMPWEAFIAKRIFKPLQMRSTRVTTTTELINNRARGYQVKNGIITNAEDWVALRPSGAFLSTVLDMAKWDAALYGDVILTAESKRQLWSPVRFNNGGALSYALGWNLLPYLGHNRVFHDGGLPGFSADFERFVDDKFTVILLCNTEEVDAGKLALTVAGVYNRALQVKAE
jgi:D-alanyl-D-alanine carboxypeptidase